MYTTKDVYELVAELNKYRDAYYNSNESLITDKEYDELFDKLVVAQRETGLVLSNSPTVTVGYKLVSELQEIEHEYPPMLSLDKSKNIADMHKFIGQRGGIVMAKMDGLTCRLTYKNGELVRAETRGDGFRGEDITHNARVIKNIPLTISNKNDVVIDGEVIIKRVEFAKIRDNFVDAKGKTYKNPRNFASGSVRLLDSQKSAGRNLTFVAWKYIKGTTEINFAKQLCELTELGFTVTPFIVLGENYQSDVDDLIDICDELSYPIDGCVFSYNDTEYMESLGYTSHHSRAQIAYKFYDEKFDTVIRNIDWTMGKTGALTPTAVFDTVEIDGTDVSRASLHNLTIMKQLNVRKNCTARVFKANMIIPQVEAVEDDGVADFDIPDVCPICGGATQITKDNDSEVLVCTNPNCHGKLLGKLCTFVSKQGLDIDGLGENNISLFMQLGLLNKLSDVYYLPTKSSLIKSLDGWGESSVNKLVSSVESAFKNVKLENFIAALSIPNVGLTTAKTIAKHFNDNPAEFSNALRNSYSWFDIEGFGEKTHQGIEEWYGVNQEEFDNILGEVTFATPETVIITDSPINGKTFCITGTFTCGKRETLKEKLEQLGGVFVDGVSKKTQVLFAGDKAGSKLKKAQELNIIIYDENELKSLIGEV